MTSHLYCHPDEVKDLICGLRGYEKLLEVKNVS